MSKRLQVLLEEEEYERVQEVAARSGTTVSNWVRVALREATRRVPIRSADRKLAAVRAATAHDFPAPDIDVLLSEIERGYLGDSSE